MENKQQLNEAFPAFLTAAMPFIRKALPYIVPALAKGGVGALKYAVGPGMSKLQKDILFSDPSGEGIGKTPAAANLADLPGKITDKTADVVKSNINQAGAAWRNTVDPDRTDTVWNISQQRPRLRNNMDIFRRNLAKIKQGKKMD